MAQTSPNLVDTSSIYLKTALFSGTNAFPAAYLDALSATSEKRILIQSMRLCNKSASPIDMEIRVYVTTYSNTFPNPPGGGSGGGGWTIKLIDGVTVPALSTMVLQSNDLDIPEHINRPNNLKEFEDQTPMEDCMFSGGLELDAGGDHLYTRFMRIGYKK